MKPLFLTILVLSLTGCAALGFQSKSKEEEDDYDPVAAIAKQYAEQDPNSEEAKLEKESFEKRIEIGRQLGHLTIGMKSEDVLDLWGEPREIETAGTPGLGYEKWVYFDGVSNRWKLNPPRIVFFEKGAVVGWHRPD